MTNHPIVTYPADVLRAPTRRVGVFDGSLQKLIAEMRELMHAAKGVGLAAPQIGQNIKLAVIEYDPKRFEGEPDREPQPPIPFLVIANPTITSSGRTLETLEEGCLSLPELLIPVPRVEEVSVLTDNEKGERVRIRAKGFLARILQHEIDHLNKILIIDRTSDRKVRKQYAKDRS